MYTQEQCKYYKGMCHAYCVPNDIRQPSIQIHIGHQCCGFYLMDYDTTMSCIQDGSDVKECSFEEFMQDFSKAVMTVSEVSFKLPIKQTAEFRLEGVFYAPKKGDNPLIDDIVANKGLKFICVDNYRRCEKCGGAWTSDVCSDPCLPF